MEPLGLGTFHGHAAVEGGLPEELIGDVGIGELRKGERRDEPRPVTGCLDDQLPIGRDWSGGNSGLDDAGKTLGHSGLQHVGNSSGW